MNKRAEAKPEDLSQSSEEGAMPMWTPGMLIRNRETGEPLLVLHVYRICTIVAPVNSTAMLVPSFVLLEREYHYFARDTDMENDDEVNYEKDWHYHHVDMGDEPKNHIAQTK